MTIHIIELDTDQGRLYIFDHTDEFFDEEPTQEYLVPLFDAATLAWFAHPIHEDK